MTAIEEATEAALEGAENSAAEVSIDDDTDDRTAEVRAAAEKEEEEEERSEAAARDEDAREDERDALADQDEADEEDEGAREQAGTPDASLERLDRKKLEEQLEALKRKEIELRRALMLADHPVLAEAVRAIEGRAFAVGRVEAKLAQGLSKSEARRKETLSKKLCGLREKRAELDEQITQLETELAGLGVERVQVYEAERREAVQQLFVALGTHDATFREVGVEPSAIVPEIIRFLPEIEALAEHFAAKPPEPEI